MKFLLHPEADAEFAEAVRYYSQVSPELGVRFYREMERLFAIMHMKRRPGYWRERLG